MGVLVAVVLVAHGSVGSSAPCTPMVVEATVVDGFRPPPEPWLPGNRGLTFGTVPDQPVRAITSGTVHFAGEIAGERYVSVDVGDGRRVTYSYLSMVAVAGGDPVTVGQEVGRTGAAAFQLGLRSGSTYLDPSPLLAGVCPARHAILVPVPPR